MEATGFRGAGTHRAMSLVTAALVAVALAGQAAAAGLAEGRRALAAGEWAQAEAALKSAPPSERPGASLVMAELYILTGRYPEAMAAAQAAAAAPAQRGRALCLLGEARVEAGRMAEGVAAFRAALAANPRELRARVYLADTLQRMGRGQEAEPLLDQFFREFNAGTIDRKSAEQLTYTAMAARRLEAWQDASDTFQDATAAASGFVLANLEWGDLFLEKYRADEAERCYADVLKVNPRHPRALTGLARAALEANYDVRKATRLADEALRSNPRYVPALTLKAHMALDDERYGPAEALLAEALAVNPASLEALTLLGASRYLQDDMRGYETARDRALQLHPRYAEFYHGVGELAARHHRYSDTVALNRQAVALDPKHAAALSALAINLLREGVPAEKEALELLRRSFERDAFNVRTFNTLKLFEEVIPADYETFEVGDFYYRVNKKERPLLERFVPRVIGDGWRRYVEKYGFTPRVPITIELFTERQHYGARTIGLPELGAQGTCFGRLITAMSPSSAEANWELVLLHELAHVFHLELSRNRVARWFTEGLCEYETNLVHPYWKREHAREIYLSLRRGNLWKITNLSSAFTRPDRPNGVVIAYQQSSLVIHFLAEAYGFPKLVQALRLYGEGKGDADVLLGITGKTPEVLDGEFAEFLRRRYPHYERGFLFDEDAYRDLEKAARAARERPRDALAQAEYAAALLVRPQGPPAAAVEAARAALALDDSQPLARYVLASALGRARDPAARAEFEKLLEQQVDGYPIRLALGTMAAAAGQVEEAQRHFAAAKAWDPDRAEPYALLMELYEAREMREALLKEAEGYLDIEEHDHAAARLLIDRYAGDRRWEDVARVAPRVIGISPMEPYVHHQYGIALAALKRHREAATALEHALLAGPRRPAAVRGLMALQLALAGAKEEARKAAREALEEDGENADAREALRVAGP